MEKICEFCRTSRPVVYCKSDAAHLCLSCDAKVHSANALSNRHLRTLLCDSCRCRPSYVRCLDHRMFMCHGCDQSIHDISSQHQRRAVSSYLGCPSAKDFAALWGFELNEMDDNPAQDLSLSNSCVSMNPNAVNLENLRQSCSRIGVSSCKSSVTSLPAAGHNIGSNSQRTKVINKGQQQQNTSFILQQILDLKKLQLTEGDSHLPFICALEQADTTSSICNSSKNVDSNLVQDIGTNLHQSDNPLDELNADPLPLSFTHLENLSSSSTSGMLLYGESFWQCKSPIHDSQGIIGTPRPIRPSYSTISFSVSRFSAESSGTDCLDSGLSPITQGEASGISPDLDSLHSEARENAMMRYKEKKKARLHERQTRSASQKARADVQKRVKGRFAKSEDHDSDNANVTRSY
ncbi:putative zinc finger protein At1g68190 isoform X3 [Durio zibethinus]|uniref:Zinc finger protein At1g68190 isoform X3 n=1 Tax=Durio zibethinus TaxID=66656 RepID=A0A6P5Y3A2_DURZI|nr:putative zinc finger protein At1g68190 isoform X3 [Durio zibethinus]